MIEEDIAAIRNALADLENKSLKIVDVFFIPWTCLKSCNTGVADHSEEYGQGLSEIEKQLENIHQSFLSL